jgi:hypothetical protein
MQTLVERGCGLDDPNSLFLRPVCAMTLPWRSNVRARPMATTRASRWG